MIRLKNILSLAVLLFFFMTYAQLQAQGWERAFGGTTSDVANDFLPTPDGGWLLLGTFENLSTNLKSLSIVKTDIDGVEQWHRSFGFSDAILLGASIIETNNGAYFIAGTKVDTNGLNYHAFLMKTTALGDSMWFKSYPQDSLITRSIALTAQGGCILTGRRTNYRDDGQGGQIAANDFFVLQTDENGIEQWYESIESDVIEEATKVVIASDSVIYISGYRENSATDFDAFLLKLNSTGGTDFQNYYGAVETAEQALDMILLNNGNLLLAGFQKDDTQNENAWIQEIQPDGQAIKQSTFNTSSLDRINAIKETNEGFVMVGERKANGTADRNATLFKLDTNYNVIWNNNYGGNESDAGNSIHQIANGYLVFSGFTRSIGAGSDDMWLVKTDVQGRSFSSTISGRIFIDLNNDCLFDPNEPDLSDWFLNFKGPKKLNATSDATGNYQLSVDTGLYKVNLSLPNENWELCDNGIDVDVDSANSTFTVDFPVKRKVDCPVLSVDISTPFLRRCFSNIYFVNYCNKGTAFADDVRIEIEMDPFITVDSASIPISNQNGNLYSFELGSLDMLECGKFRLYTTVDCNSTLLGQTHCVEAQIFPDSFCFERPALWDGSSIEVDAFCDDSLTLNITNTAAVAMTGKSDFIIIEDEVLNRTGGVKLQGSSDTTIVIHPEGKTIRLEVQQSANHPGNSQPSITVEGCGDFPFSTGHVVTFPQDDGNPFVEIDCQENIGAYDPNDKRGFPRGYGSEHFIDKNGEIEYLVRFQNTGTDTAFTVVIRDTLANYLNVERIIPGASSHDYDIELYGEGILKFTFKNILLVDSFTNEPASHGFVKYRIPQQENLPDGTIIYNSADIYFDYNEPVRTNTTDHQIGENYIVLDVSETDNKLFQVEVFPNPFLEEAKILIKDSRIKSSELRIYNSMGVMVHKEAGKNEYRVKRGNLNAGIYHFVIQTDQLELITGKIILQ